MTLTLRVMIFVAILFQICWKFPKRGFGDEKLNRSARSLGGGAGEDDGVGGGHVRQVSERLARRLHVVSVIRDTSIRDM